MLVFSEYFMVQNPKSLPFTILVCFVYFVVQKPSSLSLAMFAYLVVQNPSSFRYAFIFAWVSTSSASICSISFWVAAISISGSGSKVST